MTDQMLVAAVSHNALENLFAPGWDPRKASKARAVVAYWAGIDAEALRIAGDTGKPLRAAWSTAHLEAVRGRCEKLFGPLN